ASTFEGRVFRAQRRQRVFRNTTFSKHRGPQLKSLAIAIVLLLMTSINVQAEAAFAERGELPNSPSTSFWTKANSTLLALDATAKGADFYYTMRGMNHPGLALEADP